MGLSLKNEFAVLCVCLISGALTGVLYDVFRIIRKGRKTSAFLVFIQDLLFWICDAFLVFYGLYITCGGVIRWYDIPFMIPGFLIYYFTVSRFFVKTGFFVLGISMNVTSKLLRVLLFPLRILLKIALFFTKVIKKSGFFKKIRKMRLTYRNFCFKIKKSVHKIGCIVLRR